MRRSLLLVLTVALVFTSCAKKRTEEEYQNLAREAKSKEDWRSALKYERDLIKYYPKSEKIVEYKKAFLEDLIQAAEKDTSATNKKLLYDEAIKIGEEVDKTKANLARLRLGEIIEKSDSLKAKEIYSSIPQKELEILAQLELGNQKYESALKCYSILIATYPNDTSAYKWYFMSGFILNEYFKKTAESKEFFKVVFEKYPNTELADDAKFLYDHAGENIEEIIFRADSAKGTRK